MPSSGDRQNEHMATFARLSRPRAPLVALAQRWGSDELYENAVRASDALRQLGIRDEVLVSALNQALTMWQKQWRDIAAGTLEAPDVICADDDIEPYVAVRLPVPTDAEEASALTWTLSGMLIEKKLQLPGLSLGFFPAHQQRRRPGGATAR